MTLLELVANSVNLISIYLAARNHILTWITGIIGCVLFGALFYQSRLYADALLQVFFIVTSLIGLLRWKKGAEREERPISRVSLTWLVIYFFAGCLTATGYGALLHVWTDASYPFVDSMVLAFSVLAQLLLINRKLENWYFWIIVNLISVPLYFTKELYLTSAIYSAFLFNALWGLSRWKREFKAMRSR